MGELRSNAAAVIARPTPEIPPGANKAETQTVTAGISETENRVREINELKARF